VPWQKSDDYAITVTVWGSWPSDRLQVSPSQLPLFEPNNTRILLTGLPEKQFNRWRQGAVLHTWCQDLAEKLARYSWVDDSEAVKGIIYVDWYVYLMFHYHNTVSSPARATVKLICYGKPQWKAKRRVRTALTVDPHFQFQQGPSTGKRPNCLLHITPTNLFVNVFTHVACIPHPPYAVLSQCLLYLAIISSC